jgi:uncharacterized membrane protein
MPAVLLGIGLGGFLDGIVLHQILQWHHLLTSTRDHPDSTVAGLEANTLADGLFHLATWLAVAAGLWLLIARWRRERRPPPWRHQVGLMLAGWGGFNLVEGLVDHHILGIHHVRGTEVSGWDFAFLGFGAVLLVTGLTIARRYNPTLRRRGLA